MVFSSSFSPQQFTNIILKQNNASIDSKEFLKFKVKKKEKHNPCADICICIKKFFHQYANILQPFQNLYMNQYLDPLGCKFYISESTFFADADANIHGLSTFICTHSPPPSQQSIIKGTPH